MLNSWLLQSGIRVGGAYTAKSPPDYGRFTTIELVSMFLSLVVITALLAWIISITDKRRRP
jgi:hypothetical protein